ncbi:MAG: hypothetical protein CSA72_09720 [Rhodobacterales bacterium]|nr:MAG: hypothetical protein CSA72_09720 [Rhodobacterales bacterium]
MEMLHVGWTDVESEIATARAMVDWLGDLSELLDAVARDFKLGGGYTITLKPGLWNEDQCGAIRSASYITGEHSGIQ